MLHNKKVALNLEKIQNHRVTVDPCNQIGPQQCNWKYVNPLTPMSDEDRISPNNINTISSRQVVRIKKYINLGIISWSNSKFSELTL